mmetsp:Transcript_3763/g.5537  ORF Transcript_3763/g.5537 Transcript_3763/m.5537 type:complete len:378 (+) Transcript_3763:47-1180(+)
MDHLQPLGVRRTKVGADGKEVAYIVSPVAVALFTFVSALLLGAAVYYSWALEAQVKDLQLTNGWEMSENIDEETKLAHHFFHSAEILVNILQSEQQTVEDGVIVSEAVLQEIDELKKRISLSSSFDQVVGLVENFDLTVTNIVTAYAGSSTQLAERAKMLSKSLANVLSTEGESLQEIDDMQEWQQISTWSQISRCFSFVDDIDAVEVPEHIIDVLTEELQVLEAGVFPTGKYERPTDVREEMQQLLTSDEVSGIRPNIIQDISTTEEVFELLREVLQLFVVKDNAEQLQELELRWKAGDTTDDEVLAELEKLEAQGTLPLFWTAGPDVVGVRPRKFLWWLRPSPFDVLQQAKQGPASEKGAAFEQRRGARKAKQSA